MTVTPTRMHHWMELVQVLDVNLQDARQQLAMTAMILMMRYTRERLSSVITRTTTAMPVLRMAQERPGTALPVMGLIQTSAKREPMAVQGVRRAVQTTREIQERFVMTASTMTATGQRIALL